MEELIKILGDKAPSLALTEYQFGDSRLIAEYPNLHEISEARGAVDLSGSAKIFDIDGVLTDPVERRVCDSLIGSIREALLRGESVAFNTGRSVDWTMRHLIEPLTQGGLPAELLARVIVVAEKGCCWIRWNQDRFCSFRETAVAVPSLLTGELSLLAAKVDPQVFQIDSEKTAMFSLEYSPRPGCDINEEYRLFQEIKVELARCIERHLEESRFADAFTVDVSTIAVDVQHRSAGKDLGAARIARFWRESNALPTRVLCFGDSASDPDMSAELLRSGINSHYIHVGDRSCFRGRTEIPRVLQADAPLYDQATARILRLSQQLEVVPQSNQALFNAMTEHSDLLPAVSPWYDKYFFSAREISIDPHTCTVNVHIDAGDLPVALRREAEQEHALVAEVAQLYRQGLIPDYVDSAGVRHIGGNGARILFSAGSYVITGIPGHETILMLQRGFDAPVAPGMFQGAAGRCDRPVGASAWQESIEEFLCIAGKGSVRGFLGLVECYESGTEGAIFDARWRAIQSLRGLVSRSTDPGEIQRCQARLDLLENTSTILAPLLKPYIPAGDASALYTVKTWLGESCIETSPLMHLAFQPESNTAEFRQALYLPDPAVRLELLEDGDGFGRQVRMMTRSELLQNWNLIHAPTQSFLSDVLGLSPKQ